jgi:hypothetical protein
VKNAAVNFYKELYQLHPWIKKLIKAEKIVLTCVGGATRDYILSQKIGNDLDFEVRFPGHGRNEFDRCWQNLHAYLDQIFPGQIEELPFHVLRLKMADMDFEFSPVRVEVFNEELHHKNFVAEFYTNLAPKDAFRRRDFAMNAIGFTAIESKEWVDDPFNGSVDIQEKQLRACDTATFHLDPVRLFRAIRFSIRFQLVFEDTLEKSLKKSILSDVPSHFFIYELEKAQNFSAFFKLLWELPTSQKWMKDSFGFQDLIISQQTDMNVRNYLYLVGIENPEIDQSKWISYLGLKAQLFEDLIKCYNCFEQLDPDWKIDATFESIKDHQEYLLFVESLKRFERLSDEWREIFGNIYPKNIMKLIAILNSDKINYDQIDVKDRSSYRVYTALRGE